MTSCMKPNKSLKKRLEKRLLKLFCVGSPECLPEIVIIEEPAGPITAEKVQDLIYLRKFHRASQDLIILEREAYGRHSSANDEEISKKQEKVISLFNDLGVEIAEIIRKCIETMSSPNMNESLEMSELAEAVKALAEQVYEDEKYIMGKAELKTRPRKWKQKWAKLVKQSVDKRMSALPQSPGDPKGSTFSKHLDHMGKTMKSDLVLVVNQLKMVYPEIFEVCTVYAKNYHDYVSAQLIAATDFDMGEKDRRHLLVWLYYIYPNKIMKHPDLLENVTWETLGPLLPPEKVAELEQRYVANIEAIVEARMATSLDMEVKFWMEEKEPAVLNGVSHSELPIDIIQAINGEIEGAEKVSFQLANRLLSFLMENLAEFLIRYKEKLEEFLAGNRKHSYFLPIVIANLNSCGDYRDYIESLETRDLPEEVKRNVWGIVGDIEKTGFDALLEDLFLQLEPNFKTLSQKNGVCSHGTMLEIIKISKAYILQFKTLKPNYYQEIMETIHFYLVKEYITRLLKKKVSLKTPEQQKSTAKQIFENAALIKECCIANGSQAKWLNDAIPKLAEIVNLQDLDAIKLVVASLAIQYPDISKIQVGALLYIKGNLKSSDVRSILNILDIGEAQEAGTPKLFSQIKVS